jgi:NADH dehydrogenase
MRPLSICVLGGTGFVGSHLVSRLIRDGHRVRVLTRNRDRHRALLVLPALELRDTDVHDAAVLPEALRGHDVVINLVGILNEAGGAGFRRVHADLTRTVVGACRSAGVPRLLQMSSLRADEGAPSQYLRTKGAAERVVREDAGSVAWTIFRPSVIFGPGDGFMNKFADLLRLFPVLPIARARARFAPVYIGDVVEAMVRALGDRAAHGRTYELCGPEVLTLGELVRFVATVIGKRRLVVGLPAPAGWLQAWLMGWLPGKPLSLDNYRSLKLDSVCSENGLARLGIVPASLRAVVPAYLGDAGRAAQLDAFRRATAGRAVGA